MAKKKNGSAVKKTVLVIFVEGDTEDEFYSKMVKTIYKSGDVTEYEVVNKTADEITTEGFDDESGYSGYLNLKVDDGDEIIRIYQKHSTKEVVVQSEFSIICASR